MGLPLSEWKRPFPFQDVSCFVCDAIVVDSILADEIFVGAFYEPQLLCDFGGDYFNLAKNKLVQHDIRDVRSNLIPPWKNYEELCPGTLVLIQVSLHCYTMVDEYSKERRQRKASGRLIFCVFI
jgi:hypothetical protein